MTEINCPLSDCVNNQEGTCTEKYITLAEGPKRMVSEPTLDGVIVHISPGLLHCLKYKHKNEVK